MFDIVPLTDLFVYLLESSRDRRSKVEVRGFEGDWGELGVGVDFNVLFFSSEGQIEHLVWFLLFYHQVWHCEI